MTQVTPPIPVIASEDEPALKRAADRASRAAQETFLRLNVVQLALLTATAFVGGWNPLPHDQQRGVAIAVLVLMILALAASLALTIGTFDDKWFRCRALAENIKSAVWYFVMSPAREAHTREREYLEQINEVEARLEGVQKLTAPYMVEGPRVTEWMRRTQALTSPEKLALYRDLRLQDQLRWYAAKAQFNARREKLWQWAVFIAEFAAILYALFQVFKLWEFNAVGGVAALSAAFIAWTQTKRHSDLANSYAVAAEDLRQIEAEWAHAASEEDIAEFVREVETAVSREHSLWLEKRMG